MSDYTYEKLIKILENSLDCKELPYSLKDQGVIHDFQLSNRMIRIKPTAGLSWMEKTDEGPWVVRHIDQERFISSFSDM